MFTRAQGISPSILIGVIYWVGYSLCHRSFSFRPWLFIRCWLKKEIYERWACLIAGREGLTFAFLRDFVWPSLRGKNGRERSIRTLSSVPIMCRRISFPTERSEQGYFSSNDSIISLAFFFFFFLFLTVVCTRVLLFLFPSLSSFQHTKSLLFHISIYYLNKAIEKHCVRFEIFKEILHRNSLSPSLPFVPRWANPHLRSSPSLFDYLCHPLTSKPANASVQFQLSWHLNRINFRFSTHLFDLPTLHKREEREREGEKTTTKGKKKRSSSSEITCSKDGSLTSSCSILSCG